MHTPGLQAAVVRRGELVYAESFGAANKETGEKMTDEHFIMIGSVAKLMTVTLVYQFVDRGMVDLDADINTYLSWNVRNPDFPDRSITMRDLLKHQSGILDNWFYLFDFFPDRSPLSLDDFLMEYLLPGGSLYSKENWSQKFQSGEKEFYSNTGMTLAASVLEHAAGKSYEEIYKEYLALPLDMDGVWQPADLEDRPAASGHELNGTPLQPLSMYHWPAGSFLTTAKDFAKFLGIYTNKGYFQETRIISESAIEEMTTLSSIGPTIGIGWEKIPISINGREIWGHGGKFFGYKAMAAVDFSNQTGIILLTNGDSMDSYAFYELMRIFFNFEWEGK